MSFTDHYVLPTSAGLADGTSWANAFDLAGSQAHAVGKVGQRYNLKGDFGTIAAGTWTTGNYQQPNVWRGCENEPGDLDNRKRNKDGTLNTTGMPIINLSANTQTYGIVNIIFQNINYTANVNGYMTTNTSDDGVQFINCRFENINSGNAARIFNIDNSWSFINCDLICNNSTATTLTIGTADASLILIQCRIEAKNASTTTMIVANAGTTIEGCTVIGNGTSSSIFYLQDVAATSTIRINNNTFYNVGTPWQITLAAVSGRNMFYNNLLVNCTNPINLTNSTNAMTYYFNNRVRNVTNQPNIGGTADLIEFNINTIDKEDFIDSTNGNLNLLATSPSINAAFDYTNLGSMDLLIDNIPHRSNIFKSKKFG